MKKLIITLPKYPLANYVLVNGKNINFKMDKSSRLYVAEYESEEDTVILSTDTFNPYNRRSWWIVGMFFFIITIFGIFDVHEKNNYIYNYSANIGLGDKDNVVNLVPKRGKGPVFEVKTTCSYEETSNNKEINRVVNRRRKLLLLSKILFILLCIIVGFVLALLFLVSVIN